MAIAFAILGALVGSAAAAPPIPKHALFSYDKESSLIAAVGNPELRLNIKGGMGDGMQGAPIVLWPCGPLDHELFKMENGLIKSQADPNLCLNVAGGAGQGSPVNLWPCEHDGKREPHEEFEIRNDGRIALRQKPDMCLNIQAGQIQHGQKILLWPCRTTPPANELFIINPNGYIQVKANPAFHFNVQGAVAAGSQVVLWDCRAGPHEALEFTRDSRIRLKMNNDWCLNAEGGVGPGNRIIAWPCAQTPASNELFKYDNKRKVVYAAENPNLGFNIAGGAIYAGDEIVLWPFKDEEL